KLALVKDEHVVMALRLEAEFGLRREEAIKFTPSRDDRGDRIRLKGSTTKGGRPREIPVRNDSQRRLLDEARRLAGGGALIPPDRNYRQQLKIYENRTREAGLYRMHGLRHHYAQTRYEEITGWKSPAAGGPRQRSLTGARRRIDGEARRTIARELGHDRPSVVSVYVGS
ncbi:MAG: integrase, partial [Gammaproteobacteria bacterium]|nr:integrase [Gammaproteobacteria bacterium]